MRKRLSILVMLSALLLMLVGCTGKANEISKTEQTTLPEVVNTTEASESTPTETPKEKANLQVFIAASLKNAMTEIQTNYKVLYPEVEIAFNSDSSGTLQKQIEEGATCDIFFSAAMKQMNTLDKGGYVLLDSTVKLLENKVVLIKQKGGETAVTGFDNITKAANLALAGEDVPVGAYAREIFTNLGVLDQVMAMEINAGANVTAVLSAVSEGSNEVGIVYATDANSIKDAVEIIAEAPESSLKEPVIYPVGLIKNEGASETEIAAAKAFIEYLKSEEALKVFEAYGFTSYK